MTQPVRVVDTEHRKDGTIVKHIQPQASHSKVWTESIEKDGPEIPHIEVPVSSTTEDRDGDHFTRQGLQDMAKQYQSGDVPYYLDHGLDDSGFPNYRVLDQKGQWVDAEIRDHEGTPTLFATARAKIERDGTPNDEFAEVAHMVDQGMPVGHSVGFRSLEAEEKDAGGSAFVESDLMETSGVGIPSNPDAVAAHQLTVMAKNAGITPQDLVAQVGEALGVSPDTQHEPHPEESLMSEDDETKTTPDDGGEGLTEDEVRSMITEAFDEKADELEERIVGGVTEKLSDILDKEGDQGEEDTEEAGKDADPNDETDPTKQGGGEPRGVSTQNKDSPRGQPGEPRNDGPPEAKTPGAAQVGPWPAVAAKGGEE